MYFCISLCKNQMDKELPLQLDIERIIKTKSPKLGKRLPGFVYRFIEKTICQKRMNAILRTYHGGGGVDFANFLLKELNVTVNVVGLENIPDEGRFTFASNHPLGGFDGISLVSILGSRYDSKLKVLVNDLLMNITHLASVFLPVNSYGKQAKNLAGEISRAYESDNQILVFPAGLCSRLQPGGVRDLAWKKAFIAKTVQYRRDVIPVYFDGLNSKFFYRFARIRKMLGIKFNLELIYLPSEMFKCENRTFTVYIGKPVSWQTFDRSKSQSQWAEEMKERVYSLKK